MNKPLFDQYDYLDLGKVQLIFPFLTISLPEMVGKPSVKMGQSSLNALQGDITMLISALIGIIRWLWSSLSLCSYVHLLACPAHIFIFNSCRITEQSLQYKSDCNNTGYTTHSNYVPKHQLFAAVTPFHSTIVHQSFFSGGGHQTID